MPLRWDHQKAGVRRWTGWSLSLTSEFLATRFASSRFRLKGSSSLVDQRTGFAFVEASLLLWANRAGSLTSAYRKFLGNFEPILAEISVLPGTCGRLDFLDCLIVSLKCLGSVPCGPFLRIKRREEDQAGRVISTTKLHALLRFYLWPINVVVCHDSSGKVNLGRGLALRCFQRLSCPNVAAQHCR